MTDTHLSALAQQIEDHYELDVAVDGMHCARCMGLIENALSTIPGVETARVNFSTQRLHLSWQGTRELGDDLVTTVRDLGYGVRPLQPEKPKTEEDKRLLKAMAVAGFAMGNIMLLSVGVWAMADGADPATRAFMHWISALIALPTVLYSGRVFFKSAFRVLVKGHTNMDVPISLALILASGMSIWETLQGGDHVYFDGVVMLSFFLLIGRYLDAQARGKARDSAATLLSHLTGVARLVLPDGGIKDIAVRELRPGDIIRAAVGDRIAADGTIIRGNTEIDASLLTGESLPVEASAGAEVHAGTLNMSGSVDILVGKATDQSLLSQIVKLMETAEQSSSAYVRLADRAAALYTPIVHALALGTFLLWWLLLGAAWQDSLLVAISVLIITCPCALGLAVPVVQVLASGHLMKKGILLKSGDALEKLSKVSGVVFDKTGTVTYGTPMLQPGDWSEDDLQIAAAIAVHSRHPLSKAIVAAAQDHAGIEVSEVKEVPGAGLTATLGRHHVKLGKRAFVGVDGGLSDRGLEVWLQNGDQPPVRFPFKDMMRADAPTVVEQFRKSGLGVTLLSGDRIEVAKDVAKQAGIPFAVASAGPEKKVECLKAMERADGPVVMIGDGLNDAPALAAASVSMSPSTAMDISQQAADIVFQGDKLQPVLDALVTAKVSVRLVKVNFGLAILYNMIAVPLAVAGFVTPLIAAIAMSSSSLVVVANAFRLKSLTQRGLEAQ